MAFWLHFRSLTKLLPSSALFRPLLPSSSVSSQIRVSPPVAWPDWMALFLRLGYSSRDGEDFVLMPLFSCLPESLPQDVIECRFLASEQISLAWPWVWSRVISGSMRPWGRLMWSPVCCGVGVRVAATVETASKTSALAPLTDKWQMFLISELAYWCQHTHSHSTGTFWVLWCSSHWARW